MAAAASTPCKVVTATAIGASTPAAGVATPAQGAVTPASQAPAATPSTVVKARMSLGTFGTPQHKKRKGGRIGRGGSGAGLNSGRGAGRGAATPARIGRAQAAERSMPAAAIPSASCGGAKKGAGARAGRGGKGNASSSGETHHIFQQCDCRSSASNAL